VVEASNLQRQLLHDTRDVGRSKLASARDRIHDLNPHVQVDAYETRLTSENARELIGGYDLVADGTDNFPTRYLVNDASVLTGTPNVYASIFRFDGQVSVFAAPDGPCYRCLYPEPPPPGLVPSCAEGGVLGVLPGIVGTLQATEVVKFLLGIGEPLVGRLLLFDALGMTFRTMKVRRNPDCPVCGTHPTLTKLIDYEAFCGIPQAAQNGTGHVPEITVIELKARLDRGDRPFMLDVREPSEYDVGNLGARLIPVAALPGRLDELAMQREQEIIVHCRSGARSGRAVTMLRENGFARAVNLRGGLLAWRAEIDPEMPVF